MPGGDDLDEFFALIRVETARQESARQESARQEARQEPARQEPARLETAPLERPRPVVALEGGRVVQVQVTDGRKQRDGAGQRFWTFVVRVQLEAGPILLTERRYTDFVTLHDELTLCLALPTAFPVAASASLTLQTALGGGSKRTTQLGEYLAHVLAREGPLPPGLHAFLLPPPFAAVASPAADCLDALPRATAAQAVAILRGHTADERLQVLHRLIRLLLPLIPLTIPHIPLTIPHALVMLNSLIVLHSLIMLLPLTCDLASTSQRAGCARLRSLVEASDAECVALFEVCIPLIHDMQCVVPCTGAATLAGGRCGASLCDAPTARRVCRPGGRRMQGLRRARRRGGRAARARAQPAEAVPSARLPICPSVHVLRARVCACVHLCICASVHLCICACVRVCMFACARA